MTHKIDIIHTTQNIDGETIIETKNFEGGIITENIKDIGVAGILGIVVCKLNDVIEEINNK